MCKQLLLRGTGMDMDLCHKQVRPDAQACQSVTADYESTASRSTVHTVEPSQADVRDRVSWKSMKLFAHSQGGPVQPMRAWGVCATHHCCTRLNLCSKYTNMCFHFQHWL
mmetsp:Transcript_7256/g.12477  ORF Transcript_7256/g.12477 Transcript_7256/m.12477 type:complete len:110 (+) Transcript_7256:1909-2238(+)